MKVHLNSIPTGSHLEVDLSLTRDEANMMLEEVGGCELLSDLEARARLEREGTRVTLAGELSAVVAASCRRCLKDLEPNLDVDFRTTFLPLPELLPEEDEEELELTSEDVELSHYEGDELDLIPLIRETLLLEIDPSPLCNENCKGLCSKCGDDLNQRECGCDRASYDLRWSALQDLKKKPN